MRIEVTPVSRGTWDRVLRGAVREEGEQFGNVFLRAEKPTIRHEDDGWSGYAVVVKARWIARGMSEQEAEERWREFSRETKDELLGMLAQFKTIGAGQSRTEAVRRILESDPPYQSLQPNLRFSHEKQILIDDSHISWWHEDDGRLIYGGVDRPYAINHVRVGKVQETVKVGVLGTGM
jgi:plasmid stabilization system protein ParE